MTNHAELLRTGDPAAGVGGHPLDERAEHELQALLRMDRPQRTSARTGHRLGRPSRLLLGAAAASAVLLVLGALFLWSPTAARPMDRDYAVQVLRDAGGPGGSSAWSPTSVLDAMPSVGHRLGDVVIRGSRLVVQGRFDSWTRGATWGFRNGTADHPEGKVSWDDPQAQRRELILRLRVGAVVDAAPRARPVRPAELITVRIDVDGHQDADRVGRGLLDLGEVVVFCNGGVDGPWQRDLPWSVTDPPRLLATVDEQGGLRWPLMHETGMNGQAAALRVDAHTLDDLNRVAAHPRTVRVR